MNFVVFNFIFCFSSISKTKKIFKKCEQKCIPESKQQKTIANNKRNEVAISNNKNVMNDDGVVVLHWRNKPFLVNKRSWIFRVGYFARRHMIFALEFSEHLSNRPATTLLPWSYHVPIHCHLDYVKFFVCIDRSISHKFSHKFCKLFPTYKYCLARMNKIWTSIIYNNNKQYDKSKAV